MEDGTQECGHDSVLGMIHSALSREPYLEGEENAWNILSSHCPTIQADPSNYQTCSSTKIRPFLANNPVDIMRTTRQENM
jgi:hypothetical protein